MGKMRNAHKILVQKPEGNKPLGRPWHRQMNNIKMNLREIKFGVLIRFIWLRIGTSSKLLRTFQFHKRQVIS
jgi:hypothetical protein